jgi:hypothetical protein
MSRVDRPIGSDDEQLVRYLLGLLPDEDTDRLDEATLVDDDIAVRLRVVENDLVDSYVAGTLDHDMLEPFESRYLATPRRQQRVRFARSFMRAVDRAARARPPASRFAMSPRLMVAAALMLLVPGALLFQAVQWRNGLKDAQTTNIALDRRARALEQALTEQRTTQDSLSAEVARLRESAARTPADAPSAPTVALVLSPQTRAVGPVPAIAVLPRANSLAVDLRIESNDALLYEATLTDPATNQPVWNSGPMTATSRGGAPTVSLAIPTRVLASQHYSLALTTTRAGTAVVVASYSFEVVRR